MNESKTRARRRFNLIDFLILVLLFAAVAALCLRGNLARQLGLQDIGAKASLTLRVSSLEKNASELFSEGAVLTDPETGEKLAQITAVRRENTGTFTVDENGVPRAAYDTSRYELTLTTDASGTFAEQGFLLNASTFASAGDTLQISLSGERFEATVMEVRES